MHIAIAALLQAIGWSLVPLGWKLLRGLGFTAVAYVGVSALMDEAKEFVLRNLTMVPAEWIQVMGLLQIDVYINIIFSAYVVRAIMWGMNSTGGKTSLRWGG